MLVKQRGLWLNARCVDVTWCVLAQVPPSIAGFVPPSIARFGPPNILIHKNSWVHHSAEKGIMGKCTSQKSAGEVMYMPPKSQYDAVYPVALGFTSGLRLTPPPCTESFVIKHNIKKIWFKHKFSSCFMNTRNRPMSFLAAGYSQVLLPKILIQAMSNLPSCWVYIGKH